MGTEPDSGTYNSVFGGSWPACSDAATSVQTITCFTNSNATMDIVAPGARITSSGMGGGTSTYTGTSQASPTAAGIAALMLEANPSLTPAQIESYLESTGTTVTDPKNGLNFPLIDALAAVTAVNTHVFADVPVVGKEWMEPWIVAFYNEGITTGCGADPLIYCPEREVTRAEMAVFVLRAIHTLPYSPPAATHIFGDMPVAGKEWMEAWAEDFYAHGITTGCGLDPLRYCPENQTTRAEMAVFIDRAYSLYP